MISVDLVSIELAPTVHAPRAARRSLDGLSEATNPETLFDLRAVITELVANALAHGPRKPIGLAVRAQGTSMQGEVRDEGDGAQQVAAAMADPSRRRLGLTIVDALVDEWGVYAASTHIWFKIQTAAV